MKILKNVVVLGLAVAVVGAISYGVYSYLTPDYLEDYDDDFDEFEDEEIFNDNTQIN